VWTNSFCGHPAPGESMLEAVRRRAGQELGTRIEGLRLVLPAFRYQAVMADGTRENEMCPVFVARAVTDVDPDPEEVADATWVPWTTLVAEVAAGNRDVSPWCVQQLEELRAAQDPQGGFPLADPALLPPAARL